MKYLLFVSIRQIRGQNNRDKGPSRPRGPGLRRGDSENPEVRGRNDFTAEARRNTAVRGGPPRRRMRRQGTENVKFTQTKTLF